MILYESSLWFLKRAVVFLAALQIFTLQESKAAAIPLKGDTTLKINTALKRKATLKRDTASLTINGKVTDIYNKALTDVFVHVKGNSSGNYTDVDGRFQIDVKKESTLVFSVIGFKEQEVLISNKKELNIVLMSAGNAVETYNTPFKVQPKALSTSAISEVYTADLVKTQTPWIAGLLQGRVAGLSSQQSTGEPGYDRVALQLRGQTPVVWVDGVPQSFDSFNPEEIESITVLKDAVSLAMLGIRGSSGLINITTKRGAQGPQKISFTALSGLQSSLGQPKFLNAYDYSRLYNEALVNDGKAPVYSQADLDAYKNGTDPIGHPNVDWQKEILKKNAPYSRYDLSFSGGHKNARYFANLDYLDQKGLLKTDDANTYNTGSAYKRYIFRSNVDVDLSDAVNVYLNVFTRIQSFNQPGVQTSTIFQNLKSTPNNAYPVFNSNGSLGGNQDYRSNIYGQTIRSGYRPGSTRDFRIDLGSKGKLDMITPGLWVKGKIAINAFVQESINRSKVPAVFRETIDALGKPVFQQFTEAVLMSNSNQIEAQNKRFYTEFSAGYSRNFDNHGVDAILLANNDNVMQNSELASDIKGISGKISYNFSEKYLLDVSFAYNGTQLYPKDRRYGFFPAVGLGWNITKEDFLKDQQNWLDVLKLRASYGKTGFNTRVGYYKYNQYYTGGISYNFGESPTNAPAVQQASLANPNLTWEKALKLNVGLDAAFFKNKLSVTADYFTDKYYDLLQVRGENSDLLGAGYPERNIGKDRYSGTELQINYQNDIGSFHYFIAPNVSWIKSKALYRDEVARRYSWMEVTGRPVDQAFGYIADGLFQSTEEISKSALPVGITPMPGDIKYRDLNGDGIIDENDRTAIGNTKPQFFYGVNIGGSWKGFDFSALIQGVGNRTLYMSGNSYLAFQSFGKDQAYEHHLNRWTPENAANATYPRLSIGYNANNQQSSSYWFKPANYLRLKSVELGYNLPLATVKRIKVSGIRFFVNGYNLFTASQLKHTDPEGDIGFFSSAYPIQKLITAGVNIKF